MHPIITLRSPLPPSPPPSPQKSSPRRPAPRLTVTCQAQTLGDLGLRSPTHNLYDVLGVKRNATMTEIKCAYRTIAKTCHPDALGRSNGESAAVRRGTTDGKDFIVLHDAYVTLSDPAARARFDVSLGPSRGTVRVDGPGFGPIRRWETDQCW